MLELTVVAPLMVRREPRGLVVECAGSAEGSVGPIVLVLPLETEALLLGAMASLPDMPPDEI